MLKCLLRGHRTAARAAPHRKVCKYSKSNAPRAHVAFFPGENPAFLGPIVAVRTHHLHTTSSVFSQHEGTEKHPIAPEKGLYMEKDDPQGTPPPNPHQKRPYFTETSPQIRDIERVLASPQLAAEILDKIHRGSLSDADAQSLSSLVCAAVDWATSTHSEEAYNFLIDTWHISFVQKRHAAPLDPLRVALQKNEDSLIHMMINRGDSAAYDALLGPLYSNRPASLKSWAMVVMETLRPVLSNQHYMCDSQKIFQFLNSEQYSRQQKHKMVSIFLTKTLLSSKSAANVDTAVLGFIDYFRYLEDAVSVSGSAFMNVYKRPLMLLADAQTETHNERLERIDALFAGKTSDRELGDFLTALADVSADLCPQMAIRCWNYKHMLHARDTNSRRLTDTLTPADLTHTMRAFVNLRAYDRALAVYAAHKKIQDDAQITLLLRASERSKDWKLLQKQFEDMYGRGSLPYVVHYAVVMGALASIGATAEVEQLYQQLLRRNLEPTAPIFLALVRANINANKLEKAEAWYATFCTAVAAGTIDESHVPVLQLELFEARMPSMSAGAAVAELERLAEKQAETHIPLISSATIASVIRFLSSLYSLEGFDAVWSLAERLALVDDRVYERAIAFLTKMGRFKQADDLAYAAQLDASVPFQHSLFLGCQMRNYRQWQKAVTDAETRGVLGQKMAQIVRKVEQGLASPKHVDYLLVEVIKHFVGMKKPELARPFLDLANSWNVSSERHYVPFLQEYSSVASYDDNADVLNLYREMVSRKMAISARTYYYLSRSLLMIDSANKNGHANSFNLLQSVLEMYGFSLLEEKSSSKVSVSDLSRNAVFLLQIVSDYAIVAPHTEENMDLVLTFLKQIRAKLDKNVDYAFRVAILREMSKVYRAYGDLDVANSLVDSALKEMDEIVGQLPKQEPLPKLLQLDYRKTVDIKTQVMAQRRAPTEEYVRLLAHVLAKNVRLSAYQIHQITHKVMAAPVSKESIHLVLDSCERFLVSGNWAEVKISRKIHWIYRIFLVYLGRTMSPAAISARYDILNQLYDIQDVGEVLREFQHLRNPRMELEKALDEYVSLCPMEEWTPDSFFENLAEFFTSERLFASRNLVRPNLAAALVSAIETLCDGDQTQAFEMYDKFPETMEYLLFFIGERTRVVRFRKAIHTLLGSGTAAPVADRAARRQLSIETLQHLWGQASGETNVYRAGVP